MTTLQEKIDSEYESQTNEIASARLDVIDATETMIFERAENGDQRWQLLKDYEQRVKDFYGFIRMGEYERDLQVSNSVTVTLVYSMKYRVRTVLGELIAL